MFDTNDKAALHLRVDAVMNTQTNAVTPDLLLTDAMANFHQSNVSGMPVLDSHSGALCGMITTSDILRVFRVVMQLGLLANSAE